MFTIAAYSLGGLGLIFALSLGIASRIFHMEIDPRIEEAMEALPGANCGACGFAGCKGYAEAVIKDPEVVPNLCAPGEEEIAKALAKISGKEAGAGDKKRAIICCAGGEDKVERTFTYEGILDCESAAILYGGNKACKYGCLGYGSCVKACLFEAIEMNDIGLPQVDKNKCVGCGKCLDVCPKGVVKLVPVTATVYVACNSMNKGAQVKKICAVGCIGCKLCVKACEKEAISFDNNLASINYQNCNDCRTCMEKCKSNSINVCM
ncbi:MAG: Fe-S cluster domain-containing protein [bacterium]|nr:Fe-S cluster domain-containing protein [bacterium]